jgi:serine/threonine protein kinase
MPARLPALGAVLAGRYRILERIGTGGVGEYYRAVDERTEEYVTIKLLRTGIAHGLDEASHWFEGASSGGLFRHPNILRVEGTGLSDFGPFVIMEDFRGDNAKRLLERHGRLRKESAFAIIEPVFLALSAAHSIGLLHGDVKPENVIVCHQSQQRVAVKLLEFGVLSTAHPTSQLAASLDYLSPEQIEGRPADHRSEQFASCVLLYELLTNSLPFHGATPAATTSRIVRLPCPSLAERGVPHEEPLSAVLRRGLEKDPSRRYANMRDLLETLRPLMQSKMHASAILAELLPVATLLRHGSGTIVSPNSTIQRTRTTPIPIRESGARLASPSILSSWPAPVSHSDPLLPQAQSSRERETERDSFALVLPVRYRGRYRARAVVWQSLDEYVRARRPATLRERILYDIGTEMAGDLLLGTLSGIVHCELDPITQYIELATLRLFSGDSNWCRTAGQEAVAGILATALTRSIPPTLTIDATLRRVCRILSPLFDFAEWQVDQDHEEQRAQVSVCGLDAVCQGLRLWIVGVMERALAVAHPRPTLTIVRGETSFMPRMIIDVTLE